MTNLADLLTPRRPPARPGAFAAYLFALEAEATAAGGLAGNTAAAAAGEIAVLHVEKAA
jgi:hypothetical protein